jgi:integrase
MPRGRAANGSGSIRKRKDGLWEARYVIGRNPGTGKLIRKSVYGATADEAAKKLRAATAAVDENSYLEPEKMPLKQWLGIWLAEYTGSVKPGTIKAYKSNVELHIIPAVGAVRLSELRPHDCQVFINSLSKRKRGKAELSAKTVKNIHGVLHKALETAVKVEYVRINPANNVELPRIEQKEIRPFMGAEISTFQKTIKGDHSESLFFVALYSGMRLSELLGLQWQCVNFETGVIKVDKQLLVKRGSDTQREFGVPKNNKPRRVKVASAVMDTLKAVRKEQIVWKLKAGALWENALDLVFTDEIGNNIPHATIEHRFKRIVTAMGLPAMRFHDLRHTYATESIRLGVAIKTISEALGHYSTAFTMDIYGHVTEQMENDAALRMQDAIIERMQNA